MPDETQKLQKDPPEGSRKVIEHELKRRVPDDTRPPANACSEQQIATIGSVLKNFDVLYVGDI